MASDKKSERFPKFSLQLMALLRGKECKRKDLILLDPEGFESDWEVASHYLNEALKRMHSTSEGGYGVVTESDLPYSTLAPPLAGILQHIDSREKGNPDAYSKLHNWYWGSVFTERYGGPVETLSQRDLQQVTRWMSEEGPIPEAVLTEKSQIHRDLREVVRQGALYKGIMCVIALRGARDFFSGDTIQLHSLDDHHVFPQDFLKASHGQDERNTILNRTLIARDTNQRIIRAKRPSAYLSEMEEILGETKVAEILSSHLIDTAGRDAMRSDDFEGFIRARELSLRREIERRCVYSAIGLAPTQPSSETVEPGEENRRLDRVEAALRDVIDETLTESFEGTYWKRLVPGDIQSAVKEKRKKQTSEPVHASGSWTRGLLDFCDFSDYQRLILQKNLWPSFSTMFGSRGDTERHLVALRQYRNALKHGRELDGVTRLSGNAATIWLEEALGIKDFVETIGSQAEATKEDCLRVLVRRSVPPGQQQLYSALWQVPDFTLSSEGLISAMGRRDAADLAGVLGALGLRINGTPGHGADRKPGIPMVVDCARDRSGGWIYTLRPRMVEALVELDPPWLPARKTIVPDPKDTVQAEPQFGADPLLLDTVVVPARDDGFEEVFLGERRWHAIPIYSGRRPHIKHIAVYRVAPTSAITHVADVASIEPWENSAKCVVNFVQAARPIAPLKLVQSGRVKALQGLRYTSLSLLEEAKDLDGAFQEIDQTGSRPSRTWDKESFFLDLEKRNDGAVVAGARRYYDWSLEHLPKFSWGFGAKEGSFIPGRSINGVTHVPCIAYTYGSLEFQFSRVLKRSPFDSFDTRQEFLRRLNEVEGINIPPEKLDKRPSVSLSVLSRDQSWEQFLDVMKWFLATVESDSRTT